MNRFRRCHRFVSYEIRITTNRGSSVFLDVSGSLFGCYRFAVALRAPVALAPGLRLPQRLDLFSYLDKRRSLGLRYFSNRLLFVDGRTTNGLREWAKCKARPFLNEGAYLQNVTEFKKGRNAAVCPLSTPRPKRKDKMQGVCVFK